MKKTVLSAAVASLVATMSIQPTLAGDADIFVFFKNNPLQGVDIQINGKSLGETDARGEFSSALDETLEKHSVTLTQNGGVLATTTIEASAEQDVELSVVLSDEAAPRINVFRSGDKAQNVRGTLRGKVSSIDGSALSNAYISVVDTEYTATTDDNGEFNLALPRGTYSVLVTHPDHNKKTISNLRVVANVGTAAIVSLSEKTAGSATPSLNIAAPVEEVVILGYFNNNEDNAFTLEQMSTAVIDVLDVEQIIRFGASNVAAALQRVVGIAIVDGKYAVVRGLDGRYISSTLNRDLMPTTNAFKRDTELDLFPADILGGIEIQKSYTADLPADSTAGTILVKTQGRPEDDIHKLSLSLGLNSRATGEDFLTYEGGDSDFWGMDDGTRELPGYVSSLLETNGGFSVCQIEGQPNCVSAADAAFAAKTLTNTWEPDTESASPNWGLSYTLGKVKDFDAGTLGVYGSVNLDKEYSTKADAFVDNPFDRTGEFSEDTTSTSINAFLVAGFEFNDGSTLESTTMMLRNTDHRTRQTSGTNNNEDTTFETVDLEWKERELFAQQFQGHHFFLETHELDWRIGMSESSVSVPDRRTYLYQGGSLALSTVDRSFGELTEDGFDAGLDYMIPLTITNSWRSDLKMGALTNQRERENEIIRIGYRFGSTGSGMDLSQSMETLFRAGNFDADAFRLNNLTTPTDTYEGEQSIDAAYLNTETHYNELFTITAGVRQEKFMQELALPNRPEPAIADLDESDIYPSLALTFRPSASWQFKAAYSQTVSYPTMTERATARFYDDQNNQLIGNPELILASIDNFDLRADYYFGDSNNVSVALFYKDITNPVEFGVADGSGSATSARTWYNEAEATLNGIELDVYWSFLNDSDHSAFLGGNLTVIDSEVTLSDTSARLQLDDTRELQGQSPLLANIQLGYDHLPSGQKVTLLINYFDDRIYETRRAPQEVVFESGRISVDVNYEIPLLDEKASAKIKIANMTDEAVEYIQSGRTIRGWNEGVKFTLGFSYNF